MILLQRPQYQYIDTIAKAPLTITLFINLITTYCLIVWVIFIKLPSDGRFSQLCKECIMQKTLIAILSALSLIGLSCASATTDRTHANNPAGDDKALVDFSCDSCKDAVQVNRGSYTWREDSLVLEIEPGQSGQIRLTPGQDKWDCSDYAHIAVNMTNLTEQDAHIRCFVGNEGATDWGNSSIIEGRLIGGQRKDVKAFLYRTGALKENFESLTRFDGMSGLPGGFMTHWHTIDPADIRFIQVTVAPASESQKIAFKNARAARYILPKLLAEDPDAFFPFIDKFGQYAHDDWPGKTHNIEDLTKYRRKEQGDLEQHPAPASFNKYGGWKDGPKLEAKGHFRTEKIDGFWWLVDPKGRLFWSAGSNSVNPRGADTRITGREEYFADLPENKGNFEQFYSKTDAEKKGTVQFDFLGLNRYRKYGSNWTEHTRKLNHRRMRSWGLNTLAAWTEEQTYLMRKNPYTVIIHPWSDRITNRTPDPFDESFRANLRSVLENQSEITGSDPWCIGYFIDNEIEWLCPKDMLSQVLTSDRGLNAKKVLVEDLRKKHGTIEKLNEAWAAEFSSFQAILENSEPIDIAKASEDASAFYEKLLETYYRICKEEMQRTVPDKLYLGSRFHKHNDYILAAADKYCDVVSYNPYYFCMEHFSLPSVDKPIMSTEFHFGALDRGMLSTGLKGASDQEDRAYLLKRYMTTAQENPNIVGAHWFTFNSQATTGRGDGENYQIGLVDICDTPYPETIETLRKVGSSMYQRRMKAAKENRQ